ncbi:8463_t:CDS:1 [Diversispora eburnea]|uniref:8463_t:CDS:1 n=1 Tax=Diversispora eburnea TaxID=1213867 RepID=A0A9N9BPJ4_9GLOM|nr:8463_t:CDS:1 [Diversispora eburnea]
MNKKIIFYFLTALVILIFKTDLSYSIPTIFKYNVDANLNFWTPEKIAKAKPLKTRKTRNIRFKTRSDNKTIRNTTDFSKYAKSMPPLARKFDIINNTIRDVNVDQFQNFPIGILFISNNGELFTCTASVINGGPGTENIGVTAAHCLFDPETDTFFNNIAFSPGFDHEQNGPLGLIPVVASVITDQFRNNNDDHFDWGMIKFEYNNNGQPLGFFTGTLGTIFNPGNNVATTIRGYPNGGNLQNCQNDGLNLCTWGGVTNLATDYYAIPDLEIGNGASGAPLMVEYDPVANLGRLYSNYVSFDELEDEALAPIYDPIEFQALIGLISGL